MDVLPGSIYYGYELEKMKKKYNGKRVETEEEKEAFNNAIAKRKYIETLELIKRYLEGTSSDEICITTSKLEEQFGINKESAKTILQTLFVYGVISSTSRGEIVKTAEEIEKMIDEYKEHNLSKPILTNNEQTR